MQRLQVPSSGSGCHNGGPSAACQPTPDESSSSVRGAAVPKGSFRQRLMPELSDPEESLPSPQLTQTANPSKTFFDNLAAGFATASAKKASAHEPEPASPKTGPPTDQDHDLVKELQGKPLACTRSPPAPLPSANRLP